MTSLKLMNYDPDDDLLEDLNSMSPRKHPNLKQSKTKEESKELVS